MFNLAIIPLLLGAALDAGIVQDGRGILFGDDHVFALSAAPGWEADGLSGVSQGLNLVFYPKGKTWADSDAILYGQITPTSQQMSIQALVEQTVKDFHEQDSTDYKSEAQPPLGLPGGRKAEVYFFSGDRWGNYEAAAYFLEADTINFLIFNARSKTLFDQYLEDFRQTARSYANYYTPPATLTDEKRDSLKKESDEHLARPGGKEYRFRAFEATGELMTKAMRDCKGFFEEGEELPAFDCYLRIKPDGSIAESCVYPANALSTGFQGIMAAVKYPPHSFDSFLLHIEMGASKGTGDAPALRMQGGYFILEGGLEE